MILCSCIEGERKSLSCSINSNAVATEYTLSAELKYMMVYMFTYMIFKDTFQTIKSISSGHIVDNCSLDIHIWAQVVWQRVVRVYAHAVVDTRVRLQKDIPECYINLTRTFKLSLNRQYPTSKPLLTPTSARIKTWDPDS